MVSDSITNASIHAAAPPAPAPAPAPAPKDCGKKKRTNRSAKLKQNKLDVRREQWLSQVKGKGKEKSKGTSDEIGDLTMHVGGENHTLGNLEMGPRAKDSDGLIHHYSDSESPVNSPISSSSLLSSKNSGTNFSGSSSSSSSGGSFSGNNSDDDGDDGDDGCLDDWEAVADALGVDDKPKRPSSDAPVQTKFVPQLDPPRQTTCASVLGANRAKEEGGRAPRAPSRAWRADDACRPQCLPNLSKQRSFPSNPDRHHSRGPVQWACSGVSSAPLSCPICYEDLDVTDSNFLPCPCGFRLCLFCHKRILEQDGRCPGCRKEYRRDAFAGEPGVSGGSLTFRLSRSCSMITRS